MNRAFSASPWFASYRSRSHTVIRQYTMNRCRRGGQGNARTTCSATHGVGSMVGVARLPGADEAVAAGAAVAVPQTITTTGSDPFVPLGPGPAPGVGVGAPSGVGTGQGV